jgi:hypothetical protein
MRIVCHPSADSTRFDVASEKYVVEVAWGATPKILSERVGSRGGCGSPRPRLRSVGILERIWRDITYEFCHFVADGGLRFQRQALF